MLPPSKERNRNLTEYAELDEASLKRSWKNVAFRQKKGFALLTTENYLSRLGEDINVVLGDILLRDGMYRSPRDVSLKVMGVYEWKIGRIVLVGDVLYQEAGEAIQRLYKAFGNSKNEVQKEALRKYNVTKEAFVTALAPVFEKHRKRLHSQRATATKLPTVDSECPFSAVIEVEPRHYTDSPPSNELYPRASGTNAVISGAHGAPMNLLDAATVVSRQLQGYTMRTQRKDGLLALERPIDRIGSSSSQDAAMQMSGSLSSEVCKTEMTLELSTLDTDALFGKAINYTLLVTFVAFTQVLVLIRQMEMTSTQAGASRVSLMTVGLQAVADSYLCLGHLTMGIAVQTLFNAFATAAFFKFIIFSIFEMRYMLLIWKARRPSGFSEGWDAMRRELSMLYSRFYGSLLFGIFVLYEFQNYWRVFVFILYSFWVPQIIFSAYEDHRRPLHLIYIVGMSVTRLAIPLYFWSCPRNFLHIKPQPMSAVALSAWVLFQSIVLLTQHRFGARWFVPKAFLPEKYNYYRDIDISEYDVESQPLTRVVDEDADGNKILEVDCVICMGPVKLRESTRMVTPCNHCFHQHCLQNWLDIKMECPTCRRPLPPP